MAESADEIERLHRLWQLGALTDEEFTQAKANLLGQLSAPREDERRSQPHQRTSAESRNLAVWLHLSVLAGLLVPLAGYVAPVVIWQVNKSDSTVAIHGTVVANWLVSSTIYAFVSAILTCVAVGIVPLVAVIILNIVFPIIGAVRASRGEVWVYPLSISVFK